MVDDSLNSGVLSYERELILTKDYILGSAETDLRYLVVAVPRTEVTEFVYYFRRTVSGKHFRMIGFLSCRANGEKLVDLVVGPLDRAKKILQILDYYQIPWTEEDMTYV